MDYESKAITRGELRQYSKILRDLFDVPMTGAFPVLDVLERIPDIFEGSRYLIVEDHALPPKIMAQCIPNDEIGFTIEIKESVYYGAYTNRTGALLGFICHEICHIFYLR